MTSDGDLYTVACHASDRPQIVIYDGPHNAELANTIFITLKSLGEGRYHFVSVSLIGTESPETSERMRLTEIEAFLNLSPQNYFLHAVYSEISELPLHVALRQYSDHCVSYDEAVEIYTGLGYELQGDLFYFSKDGLDSILRRMTGYGLDDKQWKNTIIYDEVSEIYFLQASDTWYSPVVCTSFSRADDLYTVTYRQAISESAAFFHYDEFMNFESSKEMVVTLRNAGEGEYQFVSNQSLE